MSFHSVLHWIQQVCSLAWIKTGNSWFLSAPPIPSQSSECISCLIVLYKWWVAEWPAESVSSVLAPEAVRQPRPFICSALGLLQPPANESSPFYDPPSNHSECLLFFVYWSKWSMNEWFHHEVKVMMSKTDCWLVEFKFKENMYFIQAVLFLTASRRS